MRMRKIALLVLPVITVSLASVWLVSTKYRLADAAGVRLVCNSRECYLFIEQGKLGWKANEIRLIANSFVAALGGANPPTDRRKESLVIAIRRSGVERYWFPGTLFPDRVYHGDLYVAHAKQADPSEFYRSLGRNVRPEDYSYGSWTGTGLEPVSAAQKKEVVTAKDAVGIAEGDWTEPGLLRGSSDGWVWVYTFPFDRPVRFELDGGTITLTKKGNKTTTESIVLKTSDGREQTLWSVDYRQHRVSREEYERTFAGRAGAGPPSQAQ